MLLRRVNDDTISLKHTITTTTSMISIEQTDHHEASQVVAKSGETSASLLICSENENTSSSVKALGRSNDDDDTVQTIETSLITEDDRSSILLDTTTKAVQFAPMTTERKGTKVEDIVGPAAEASSLVQSSESLTTTATCNHHEDLCLSSSSSSSRNKSVRFQDITIREYDLTIGDNPSVSDDGVAVTLAWEYSQYLPLNIDLYEGNRGHRRAMEEMKMNFFQRKHLLKYVYGYTETELHEAKRAIKHAKNQRAATQAGLRFSKMEEALESMSRKLRRCRAGLLLGSKRGKKR